jgi:ATP-dependent exoDNAse (exonuclease V) beta subunit
MVDQHERDLAATDLATTYIVEAAAGTGKTTLLVERILSIIRDKQIPLAQIVAITFTEKAAGELKIKLRKMLEESAQEESHHAHLFHRALLELDSMPVSTIHSFCRELIQERPVEAGVDPNFMMSDQATADLLRSEVWQEWIAREFSADCPAARPFLERGIPAIATRGFSLRDVYYLLLDYRENLAELHVECLTDGELQQRISEFVAELRADLAVLDACREPSDKLVKELKKIADWTERFSGLSLDAAIHWLENSPTLSGQKGQQGNWATKEELARARQLRKGFADRVQDLQAHVISRWARDLVEWLKGAALAHAEAKGQRGLLDFQDLLLVARNMLRDSEAARQYFKGRFSHILVDEFQDTDPLQAEIVFHLAERPETFAARWEDTELVPGKLFIVGDPKQSIYRFRRADLDLYGKVRAKIENTGKCLHIRMNFRSVPDILLEVNAVFAPHMTGARNGRYEPEYVALEARRSNVTDLPQAVFLPPPAGWWDGDPKAKDQAQAEAACIAEYIRNLAKRDGHSFRDVGILYSTTTHLMELENALRARDIPYQVAGGKKLIERGEVMALRTVVAALDNPFDEISVVGALRSPFFACSDEELVEQRLHNVGFNYARDTSEIPHLEQCFAILRDLHRHQSRRAPSETIAELFERTKGLQIYALKPQGDGRIANLLKLLDMARALEGGPACSFHSLARRLAKLEEVRVGEEDSVTAETGDDVVQLLTIHKAKGLEFPVVILFRLGQDRDQKDSVIVRRGTRTLDFSVRQGFETAGFAAARADEADRAKCESMRLLYVAMTRAREQLVIPAYWTESTKGFYDLLRARYEPNEQQHPTIGRSRFQMHDTSHYSLETPPTEALKFDLDLPESSPVVQASLARRVEWQTEHSRAAERLVCEQYFAAPSRSEEQLPHDNGHPGPGRGAVQFGGFVHRLLERVALPGGQNLEQVAIPAAAEFDMGQDQIAHGKALVLGALRSGLFARIAQSPAVYREVPFVNVHDGVLWEGVIDLLFLEDGRLTIVDFKTDRLAAAECERHAATHALQLAAYRRAIAKISGLPVAETWLYFLEPDHCIKMPQ